MMMRLYELLLQREGLTCTMYPKKRLYRKSDELAELKVKE